MIIYNAKTKKAALQIKGNLFYSSKLCDMKLTAENITLQFLFYFLKALPCGGGADAEGSADLLACKALRFHQQQFPLFPGERMQCEPYFGRVKAVRLLGNIHKIIQRQSIKHNGGLSEPVRPNGPRNTVYQRAAASNTVSPRRHAQSRKKVCCARSSASSAEKSRLKKRRIFL